MRFIALSCLSSAVLAILDMNQLMTLKNQASDSTMQSANRLDNLIWKNIHPSIFSFSILKLQVFYSINLRCEFDKCMKCLAVLKKKDTTKRCKFTDKNKKLAG